jgi:xylulokinase
MYTLGIDIGTTNIKSVIFAEKAKPIAQAIYEYKTYFPRPSLAQQNPDDWWKGTTDTIHRVLYETGIDPAEIAAVAISSQAPTMLPVDSAGKPMYDALIWMDRRSIRQCNNLLETIGNNEIFRITGNRVDPFYLLGKLIWYCENYPGVSKKINKLLSPNGYINFKLTGEYSLDPANASLSQAYDVTMNCWSEKLLDTAGVDSSIFPHITEGHLPIGQVSAWASSATGLKKGTVVLAGTVDGAAAAMEAGISGGGVAAEMTGTSSVLLKSSKELTPSFNLTSMYSAIPGEYLSLGAMSSTAVR